MRTTQPGSMMTSGQQRLELKQEFPGETPGEPDLYSSGVEHFYAPGADPSGPFHSCEVSTGPSFYKAQRTLQPVRPGPAILACRGLSCLESSARLGFRLYSISIWGGFFLLLIFFSFLFLTGTYCVYQAGHGLTLKTRLASNSS